MQREPSLQRPSVTLRRSRYVRDLNDSERPDVLSRAEAVLAKTTSRELRPEELPLLRQARVIQFLGAGLDYVPLSELPANVPVAKNAGAWGEPMAEHTLAMALAAAKRLFHRATEPLSRRVQPIHAEQNAARRHLRRLRLWRQWHRGRAPDAVCRNAICASSCASVAIRILFVSLKYRQTRITVIAESSRPSQSTRDACIRSPNACAFTDG
jgi:hypothetical protein